MYTLHLGTHIYLNLGGMWDTYMSKVFDFVKYIINKTMIYSCHSLLFLFFPYQQHVSEPPHIEKII